MNYYKNDTILFLDGKFLRASEAGLDPYSQTVHYGYGVFDGIRSYHTVNGVKLFQPQKHFDRLLESCKRLGVTIPYSSEELIQIAYRVLEMNNLANAYVRPLVYCGPNMALTKPKDASVVLTAWHWGRLMGESPLRVCVSSFRRPHPRSIMIDTKVCGQYIYSIMAGNEAKEREFDEPLLLDCDGYVSEGNGANLFYEKNGVLYTPPLGNIFPGITRNVVMGICSELEIPVEEKLFRPEDLYDADGAFFCGTAAEIAGIASIEGQQFLKPWNRSLGAVIQEAYMSLVMDKSYSYVIV